MSDSDPVGGTQLGFRHLLIGILTTFLLAISIPTPAVGAPLRVALLGTLLVLAVHTRRKAGVLGLPALVTAAVLTATTLLVSIFGSQKALTSVSQISTALLAVAAIVVLARTLLTTGIVNSSTVNGVLCIYLLIALFFGSLNELFAALTPHYVHGDAAVSTSQMLYFCVITLSTVGFGDITPASSLAQGVTATEALIGQLYLVSVVAAVVSRYEPKRRD